MEFSSKDAALTKKTQNKNPRLFPNYPSIYKAKGSLDKQTKCMHYEYTI